jgi:hypothetical protein
MAGRQTNRLQRFSAFASSGGCMGVHVSMDPCGSCSSSAVSSSRRVVNKAKHADVLVGDGLIVTMGAVQKATDLFRRQAKPSGKRRLGLSQEGYCRVKYTPFAAFTNIELGGGL